MDLPSKLSYIFLISTMLSIGLEVSGGEIRAALNSRSQLVRALFANLVVMPLFGWLITRTIRLENSTTAAILLAASAPGGLRALQFTGKVKDNIYFAAGLMLLLIFAAIIVTPFLVSLLLTVETPYHLPYLKIGLFILGFLLFPLAVGHLILRRKPDLANLLRRPMMLISNISFVTTVVLTLAINKQSTRAIGSRGVVAMLILIVGGLLAGWLFGGPVKGTRRVVAVNTSMRNVGLCLVIAEGAFASPDVEVAVLAFAALMVPPNMLFTLYHAVKAKRAQKSAFDA